MSNGETARELGSLDAVTQRIGESVDRLDGITRRLESEMGGVRQALQTLGENDREQFGRIVAIEKACAANHGTGAQVVRPTLWGGGIAAAIVGAIELAKAWFAKGGGT